jgi:hypothetical protein
MKTTEDFIQRARDFHGDKYDYGKSVFVRTNDDVIVTCKTHGDFLQKPCDHVRRGGCPACRGVVGVIFGKKDLEHFLQRATAKHGDKYDYSKTAYETCGKPVVIICKTHGEFNQTPENHYAGKGCERCSRVLGQEDFIQKAKIKHNDKYNYDKVVYVGSQSKVIITCPEHGDFEQVPASHMVGYGCISCKNSSGEESIRKLLDDYAIDFVAQKSFPDLRRLLPLRFDFYLPEFNIVVEYDGIQHEKALRVFGGIEGLKRRQECDKIKTDYCVENGIKLIRISYKDDPKEILLQNGILV